MATEANLAPQQNDGLLTFVSIFFVFPVLIYGNTFIVEYIGGATDTQSLSDFIKQNPGWSNVIYFFATSALIFVCLGVGWLIERLTHSDNALANNALVGLILASFAFAYAGLPIGLFQLSAIGWRFIAPPVQSFVEEHQLRFVPFVVTVFIALSASYGAYYARTKARVYYGIGELGFGVASILFSVYAFVLSAFAKDVAESELWKVVFSFFTGVYIIVRGLTNIEEGLKKGALTFKNAMMIISKILRPMIDRLLRTQKGRTVAPGG